MSPTSITDIKVTDKNVVPYFSPQTHLGVSVLVTEVSYQYIKDQMGGGGEARASTYTMPCSYVNTEYGLAANQWVVTYC